MTFPRQDKERLIFFASYNVSPSAPDFETFSLPARSTRYNFPFLILPSAEKDWMLRMIIVWLLELCSLSLVEATFLP